MKILITKGGREPLSRKVIAGNWKMNKLPNEAIEFISKIEEVAARSDNEVILCVPFTDLFYSLLTAQNTKVKIGAQNMHWEEKGAYTGEVSGKMLKSIGTEYVIIGHSERRQYFAETDETVNKKLKAAFANELKPILCVGETLEQREQGIQEKVITEQVQKALEGLTNEQIQNTYIAYEPIWAIGTGKTATAKDASNAMQSIRKKVEEIAGVEVAQKIILLYGGSVKPDNAKPLLEAPDVDGALIGGASLQVEEFTEIIEYNDK